MRDKRKQLVDQADAILKQVTDGTGTFTAEQRAAYDKALAHSSTKDLKKKALRALADLALAANDIDGAIDARAVPAWFGQQNPLFTQAPG